LLFTFYLLLFTSARAQIPAAWKAEASSDEPYARTVYRGESLALAPEWTAGGEPVDTTGWAFTAWWSTNGVSWWSKGLGPDPSLTVTGDPFAWTPEMDCGARQYRLFIRAENPGGSVSYRANARLAMLDSPGYAPNALPMPVQALDFDAVKYLNAPWLLPMALEGYATEAWVKGYVGAGGGGPPPEEEDPVALPVAQAALKEARDALNLAMTKADAPVTRLHSTGDPSAEVYAEIAPGGGGHEVRVTTSPAQGEDGWYLTVDGARMLVEGMPEQPLTALIGNTFTTRPAGYTVSFAMGSPPYIAGKVTDGAGIPVAEIVISMANGGVTVYPEPGRDVAFGYWYHFPEPAATAVYALLTQTQIDALATKADVDAALADSADYNWKFIQGLGGTTISSASRMVYWPYTSPSSSAFQPWLYTPTVTYPKMDFRVWEGTGAHNVGKYFTIRCQLYADVIEKTTQTRMGKDLTLYLTPSGFKTTLPNLTADMFPSAGAVVEIQGVDFAVTLLSALGYDPSLFEADIGSLAWAANMSSGTGAVNPRIQFRRHRE